jgi:hypothetical protein
MILVSLGGGWTIASVAARRVKRIWRDEPPSPRVERISKALRMPVLGAGLLRRWLHWRLAKNPVGWLEQRRTAGRLVVWSWIAIVGLFYGFGGLRESGYDEDFKNFQALLACLLIGSMAMAAAGSFRRERETRVLELLLVSPMNEWEIIGGRLRALWGQFLPAMGIFFIAALLQTVGSRSEKPAEWLPYFALLYVTIPVLGLYFSLARRQFLAAFLWTLLLGGIFPFIACNGVLPEIVSLGLFGLQSQEVKRGIVFWITFILQGGLTVAFALILRDHLTRRRFALD